MASTNCACGRPLHYSNANLQQIIEGLIHEHGEFTTIVTPDGKWRVPRHYVALHGVTSWELPALAKQYGWEKLSDG